jgi:hypothetical protein
MSQVPGRAGAPADGSCASVQRRGLVCERLRAQVCSNFLRLQFVRNQSSAGDRKQRRQQACSFRLLVEVGIVGICLNVRIFRFRFKTKHTGFLHIRLRTGLESLQPAMPAQ